MNIQKLFLILILSSLSNNSILAQQQDDNVNIDDTFVPDMECTGPCTGDTTCKTYPGIGFCPPVAQCVKTACTSDSDCRLFNNYSEEFPCTCDAVLVDAPDPVCEEEQTAGVHCFAEPCHDLVPACSDEGECYTRDVTDADE